MCCALHLLGVLERMRDVMAANCFESFCAGASTWYYIGFVVREWGKSVRGVVHEWEGRHVDGDIDVCGVGVILYGHL